MARRYVTRLELVNALQAANVRFNENARVADLRPIYDELMADGRIQPNIDADDEYMNAENGDDDELSADANDREGDERSETGTFNGHGERTHNAYSDDEMDRERRLLRKQREIMQLKAELQQMGQRRFDFIAFESMVHRFSGDDVYDINKWLSDLDDAFAVFECSARDKFILHARGFSAIKDANAEAERNGQAIRD